MSNNKRVLNITRDFTIKHKQACKAIENCSMAWVEYGISVRDLTIKESIEARMKQKTPIESLPYAEIPGITFIPSNQQLNLRRLANPGCIRQDILPDYAKGLNHYTR